MKDPKLALKVSKEYNATGWTGFYIIVALSSKTLKWHTAIAHFDDYNDTINIAETLAKFHGIPCYDANGKEITKQ